MRHIITILLILYCLFTAPLYAQTIQAGPVNVSQEIIELKAQITLLADRLAQIEQSEAERLAVEAERVVIAPPPHQAASSWTEKVRFSGDIRYRHESINDDFKDFRNRHRIRSRTNLTADLSENTTVGLGFSSGDVANDSGNQTLDDGFNRKPLGIDLAYFNWGLSDSFNLIGGKMSNPFFRPAGYHLIYDSDLRPEGLSLRYSSGAFFSNAATFWAEERGSDVDSMLLGLQGGYRGTMGNDIGLTVGASYYETTNTKGFSPLFEAICEWRYGDVVGGCAQGAQGNQVDADGNYLYGFSEIELFAELRLDLDGEPLTVFADYVTNTAADAYEDGFAFGGTYRRLSNPGDWTMGYAYQDLGGNAVVGAFTDSDFGGGTSDASGHTLSGSYMVNGGWYFALRYVIGKRGEAAGQLRDYNRLMTDINFRY